GERRPAEEKDEEERRDHYSRADLAARIVDPLIRSRGERTGFEGTASRLRDERVHAPFFPAVTIWGFGAPGAICRRTSSRGPNMVRRPFCIPRSRSMSGRTVTGAATTS